MQRLDCVVDIFSESSIGATPEITRSTPQSLRTQYASVLAQPGRSRGRARESLG